MENIAQIRRPEEYLPYGDILTTALISNFGGTVHNDVAEVIKGKLIWAAYYAWNFGGEIWWQNEQWHCEIWQYHAYVETISAKTLNEIREIACNKFGSD